MAESSREETLRKLVHDVRAHLHVIRVGLELLADSRENADDFARFKEKILETGVDPLAETVERLVKEAGRAGDDAEY